MIRAALLALQQAVSPPFRGVLLKSVGLALALLVLAGIGLEWAISRLIDLPNANVDLLATVLASVGIVIGLFLLIPPVTSLMAGLFLDEIAGLVERTHYPGEPEGRALPFGESLLLSLRFFGIVVLVNLGVLILLLLPGINLVAYLVANGYLLGREYFELAALRFRPPEEARALRRRNALTIFLAGLLIAGFVLIPIVNLATPLVATAFMVHIHKWISRRERDAVLRGPAGGW